MTEIRYYHLQHSPLERALPQLLEKILERGKRAVVLAGSEERVAALNKLLWTFDDRGFLPHGRADDGFPEAQPVYLSAQDERPNAAEVLVLTDGLESARLDDYEICCLLFDGSDADAVARAREGWKSHGEAGHQLSYWQQTDRGAWELKQSAGGAA